MTEDSVETVVESRSIHHVVVVGFHHKKGCIVEYSYPPMIEGEPHNSRLIPEEWKYLPYLALPDGAHNFLEDTIYFHLPPRVGSTDETVYCVSCYRQIDSDLLKVKDEDVTRGTVQKSVVIMSKLPMYGLIHMKLRLITHAYFEEKDFSQKHILMELYNHINISVSKMEESQKFLGLSARNLVMSFEHKVVMLFKLVLLEKRVIFHVSPVHKLVETIMALLSLFPHMIETGLSKCASMHEAISFLEIEPGIASSCDAKNEESPDCKYIIQSDELILPVSNENSDSRIPFERQHSEHIFEDKHGYDEIAPTPETMEREPCINSLPYNTDNRGDAQHDSQQIKSTAPHQVQNVLGYSKPGNNDMNIQLDIERDFAEDVLVLEFENARLEMKLESHEKPITPEYSPVKNVTKNTIHFGEQVNCKKRIPLIRRTLKVDKCGFPLNIFTGGHLCLPYVCLQQYDLLRDDVEHGFIAGATNVLFTTRQNLCDVVIDVENAEFVYHDSELRKLLHLSAADLRFADHLVCRVMERGSEDVFLDATGWEGGDDWIRGLFAEYLNGMLSVSVSESQESKQSSDYNEGFLVAWKQTNNYRIWKQGNHLQGIDMELGHPFHGRYSVSDMKLRLRHNIGNGGRVRKIEGALSNANMAMANTGKFVDSAIVSVKSSITSWFSSKKPST